MGVSTVTFLLAIPALLVLYAIFHVPAQITAWLHVTRQQWQPHLGEKASRWTRAKYVGVRVGIQGIGLASIGIGCHYVWLVGLRAGWWAVMVEAAR